MFEFHRNERARQLRPSLSRSWLLVRANSTEEVFEEAFESEADSIIIDLEDGCPRGEGRSPRAGRPYAQLRRRRMGANQRHHHRTLVEGRQGPQEREGPARRHACHRRARHRH